MAQYITKDINIQELYLDEKNPRFIIPPNPSQQSIVDYLIDYEEVEQLAIDIANSGGLNAGERVIVTEEDGRYIVLEGNRRVCACKILLQHELLLGRKPASVDKISLLCERNKELKASIDIISADVMPTRISAQSSLAAKHIDGIKRWSTISKYKFFVLEFDAGKTLEEIAMVTGVSVAKIRTGLKEYRIIDYVLNLPFWSEEQRKKYLNLQEIKTTRLTRLFSAKPNVENGKRLRDILGLTYDQTYQIQTTINKIFFEQIMYIVAQAAFVPDYCDGFNGTRSTYEDIPQLMRYLKNNNILNEIKINELGDTVTSVQKENTKYIVTSGASDEQKEKQNIQELVPSKNQNKPDVDKSVTVDRNSTEKKCSNQYTSKRNFLIPNDFVVTCKVVKINDIVNELKRLNLNNTINAQAVLLRVLLELSLKYYLTKINKHEKIDEKNLDGTYVAALENMKVNKLLSNTEHSNLIQLRKNDKVFNVFNGYIHYESVLPNKDILLYYFDNMRRILEICLNN